MCTCVRGEAFVDVEDVLADDVIGIPRVTSLGGIPALRERPGRAARLIPATRVRASARHSRRNQYRPSTVSRCSFSDRVFGPIRARSGTAMPFESWTTWNDSWRNASPRVRAGQMAIVSQLSAAHPITPLYGPIQQTDNLRARRIRRRLAGGERLCPCVADHHRCADRHSPEATPLALAERLGFLKVTLCAFLIDLSYAGDEWPMKTYAKIAVRNVGIRIVHSRASLSARDSSLVASFAQHRRGIEPCGATG